MKKMGAEGADTGKMRRRRRRCGKNAAPQAPQKRKYGAAGAKMVSLLSWWQEIWKVSGYFHDKIVLARYFADRTAYLCARFDTCAHSYVFALAQARHLGMQKSVECVQLAPKAPENVNWRRRRRKKIGLRPPKNRKIAVEKYLQFWVADFWGGGNGS